MGCLLGRRQRAIQSPLCNGNEPACPHLSISAAIWASLPSRIASHALSMWLSSLGVARQGAGVCVC